jgi:hypothetical protein
MARFPSTEPEIAALALVLADGLAAAPEDFPTPPVPAADLQGMLDAYRTALIAAVGAETEARQHHALKDDALETMVDGMKANLRYAEVAVRNDPEKLQRVGWGPRRQSASLEVPGEVRDIGIVGEGEGWLVLDWKPPVDGGTVAAYAIQRRTRDGGSWETVGNAVTTETLLSRQERGVEFEYRVVGVNKAGTGKPSRAVTVVL